MTVALLLAPVGARPAASDTLPTANVSPPGTVAPLEESIRWLVVHAWRRAATRIVLASTAPAPAAIATPPARIPAPRLVVTATRMRRAAGIPGPDVGQATTYGPGYSGYIAVPHHGRWLVRITWHGRHVIRQTNDYGPDQRVFPDRVIDLDVLTFEALSGESWTAGLLDGVTVEYIRYLGSGR